MGIDLIRAVENEQIQSDRDNFSVGDTVKVHFKIVEGKRERVQIYEGTVIAINNGGVRRTMVVRKISYGVGVERIFPVHSPRIEKIEVVRRGRVRRAKLYYLRDRVGKSARVRELIKPRGDAKKRSVAMPDESKSETENATEPERITESAASVNVESNEPTPDAATGGENAVTPESDS